MTPLLLLALAAAPGATTASAPAAPQTPAAAGDAELARIAEWMTGDFTTFDQVARDDAANTAYRHMRAVMHIVPVTLCGLSGAAGRTFYVEQAAAGAEDRPYRQRVYLLTRRDGNLINRIYKIKDPDRFVGAYRRPGLLAALTPDDVILDEGCDLLWTRVSDALYTGLAGGEGTCKTTLRGATHVVSKVEITPASITSLDQGFDDSGAHKWGPPLDVVGHTFAREKMADATLAAQLAREFAELRAGPAGQDVYWYVEGLVYAVRDGGRLEAVNGIAGFNAGRLAPAGKSPDFQILSSEIFFTTDLRDGHVLRERAPIQSEVNFKIGVRDGKALAGIDFWSAGRSLAEAVPPVAIHKIATKTAVRWFTAPFVDVASAERTYWASELYEFTAPVAESGKTGAPELTWQRDADAPGVGRVHYVAAGRRFTSLDELAKHSKLAAEIAALVKDEHAKFAAPPAGD